MEFPFADPQRMFDWLFGEETEEDRKALAAIEVSAKEERQMGEAAVQAYLSQLRQQGIRVISRGPEVGYLRDLVRTIHPLMQDRQRYPVITVYLAQSSRCDARSFPGGILVFFRGLLESAQSEAALIGIVGHELSHLDRGHHLRRVRRLRLLERTFSGQPGEFSPERFFSSSRIMFRTFTQPFQPDDEAEADRDGARWAYQAGYDPREMAELLLRLGKRDWKQPFPIPSFLRTHPVAQDRHRTILQLYEKLQQAEPKEELYIGRENLRRRVARHRRRFGE
jgi:predicted Zn-dependent protease